MFGGLRIGDQVDRVGLADFLEGPARAHIADKAAREFRHPAEGGDGWKHVTFPVAVSGKRINAWLFLYRSKLPARSRPKCRSSLSSAPAQPSLWLSRDTSVCRRECVKVSSVPVSIGRRSISTRDSSPASTGSPPWVQRQLMARRVGLVTSVYSPLLSCSLPSCIRNCTRKRPPTRTSVSASSTGPSSGPHQQAMPSGVVNASNTIAGRAAIRRTRVRLVMACPPV